MTHIKCVRAAIACTLALSASGCALLMPIEDQPVSRYHTAETAWQVMNVIDAGQTLHLAKAQRTDDQMAAWKAQHITVERACFREANPMTRALIGEHPSEAKVALSSILFTIAHYEISAWLESKDTLNEWGEHNSPWYVAAVTWHTVGLATKFLTIANNHNIGMRVGASRCPN